jgi:hypothetical protein
MTKAWLSWIPSNDKAIIDVLVEQTELLVLMYKAECYYFS